MTSSEIRALRDRTNVPFGSIESISVQIRQLGRDGLSWTQIVKAVWNLHPRLMENLVVTRAGKIKERNPNIVWNAGRWVNVNVRRVSY
jgi:hypothetical protein